MSRITLFAGIAELAFSLVMGFATFSLWSDVNRPDLDINLAQSATYAVALEKAVPGSAAYFSDKAIPVMPPTSFTLDQDDGSQLYLEIQLSSDVKELLLSGLMHAVYPPTMHGLINDGMSAYIESGKPAPYCFDITRDDSVGYGQVRRFPSPLNDVSTTSLSSQGNGPLYKVPLSHVAMPRFGFSRQILCAIEHMPDRVSDVDYSVVFRNEGRLPFDVSLAAVKHVASVRFISNQVDSENGETARVPPQGNVAIRWTDGKLVHAHEVNLLILGVFLGALPAVCIEMIKNFVSAFNGYKHSQPAAPKIQVP